MNLGKFEEAIRYLDEAIELDPNYAIAWNNRGYALDNLGKFEEGIYCYDKALELDPNLTVAQENKDLAYKRLGKKIKYYKSDGKPVL